MEGKRSMFMYQAIMVPDEEGGFDVTVPALEGCFTYGSTYEEASLNAADAMRTYVASLLKHGELVPRSRIEEPKACEQSVIVCFEADPSWMGDAEVISAAEAARRLGVSPGRVTRLLDSGRLDGYRSGRNTWIIVASVEKRLAEEHPAGRPRRGAAAC